MFYQWQEKIDNRIMLRKLYDKKQRKGLKLDALSHDESVTQKKFNKKLKNLTII